MAFTSRTIGWKSSTRPCAIRLFHTLAIALAALVIERQNSRAAQAAAWSFLIGIVIFSGSLYALVLSDAKWWGAITPVGGLSLLAGWIALAIAALRKTYHPSE